MAIEVRVPSGSKIPPLFTPVEVFQIGNPGQPTQLIVHNGMLYVYNPAGQTLIDGGIIQTLGVAVGLKAWVHDIVFSATDQDTADWASGAIYFGDGSTQAIDAGDTGDIGAKTYIYYDGTATLKKTTNANFISDSFILIATVEEGAASEKCVITVSQLPGGTISAEQVVTGFLDADRIEALSIVTAKLAVGAVTEAKLGTDSVTGLKIKDGEVVDAKIGSMAAGKLLTGTLTVAVDVGEGNVKIDGANKRILINDGTDDRILMGYQSGGF